MQYVETCTDRNGSNMDRIEYQDRWTIPAIVQDVHTITGWDYAYLTRNDGSSIIVYRVDWRGAGWYRFTRYDDTQAKNAPIYTAWYDDPSDLIEDYGTEIVHDSEISHTCIDYLGC